VTKFGIFSDPARKLSSLTRPNAAEYCYSEKKLVQHRWLLYACATFRELWRTNPRDPRAILLFLKTNNMFYFHSLDGSTVGTRKRLCVFGTFCAVLTVFWLFLTVFDDWYTVGTVLVDLWRLVHQWFWVFLTISTVCHSSKTFKRQSKQQKWPLVYQSSLRLCQQCINRQKQSKTVKRQSNSKKMTIGVPVVTCLHRVRRIHKAAQTPLPCETSITRAWAVATARRPWAVCVWLPFAAVCCYTLFYQLMMPAARLVCQRPSSNFSYFRTPLANFLLSRPNSVEYGNSETTTLLPSGRKMSNSYGYGVKV